VLVSDYRDTTVVTLYLLPNLVEKLKPRLLELKPGTSYRFEGRVRGGLEIEGVVRSGAGRSLTEGRWRATRVVSGGGEG